MKKGIIVNCKRIFALLFVALLLMCTKTTAFAYEAKVNQDGVNVRASADEKADVVTSVNSGTAIDIQSETKGTDGNTWYQISINGVSGYIRADFVEGGGNNAAAAVSSDTASSSNYKERKGAIVSDGNVNVRSGAGTLNATVGTIAGGTEVTVIGEDKEADGTLWYKIRYNGTNEGFVRNDFIKVEEVVEEEPKEDPVAEAPVTEDPASTKDPGMMGQQYTVAYDMNESGESVPYLVDNNSSARYDVGQLIKSLEDVNVLNGKIRTNNIWRVLSVIFIIISIALTVVFIIVALKFRKYLDGDNGGYSDSDYDDDEDDYDDYDDDFEDEEVKKPVKKGGFFSRNKKSEKMRDDDYDDYDDDFDDEDDDDYEERPKAIKRVYSPEKTSRSSAYDDKEEVHSSRRSSGRVVTPSRASKRPRNFMEEDDDFEYGFLDEDE